MPANVIAANSGVMISFRSIFEMSGRIAYDMAAPSANPTTAAIAACSPRIR